MSSLKQEELLVYGYIKEYHRLHNIDLPPNDIILLFVSWIRLMDSFDKDLIHKDFQFDSEICTKFKRERSDNAYASLVGSFIVKKGMTQRWTFRAQTTEALLGIMEYG